MLRYLGTLADPCRRGSDLPTMGPFARKLLSQLNEAEIDALYAYPRQLSAAAR